MHPIVPTVGRVVLVSCPDFEGERPALITMVHSEGNPRSHVGLAVLLDEGDEDLVHHTGGVMRITVPCVYMPDEPAGVPSARWMPYQAGQAAKTSEVVAEAAEQMLRLAQVAAAHDRRLAALEAQFGRTAPAHPAGAPE